MTKETRVQLGDVIPAFMLKDQHGEVWRVADFRGHRLLLSFHPLAWTKVCAEQMRSLEDNRPQFIQAGCLPVGINVDPVPSKNAWAKSLGIKKTPLLSDFWPHGQVAQSLGIFRDQDGFSERANILLDEKGKVIFMKIYPISQLPDLEEILYVLRTQ